MIVLISLVLLVLAVAIVVLFAMLGELATRVPEPEQPWVRPMDDVRVGAVPGTWPSELAEVGKLERPVLLVLSTICSSCRVIASRLRDVAGWEEMAVVVSTSHAGNGRAFISEFQLEELPHYIDVEGEWVGSEFSLDVSPTALVFRNGQMSSAYSFNDPLALRAHLDEPASGGSQVLQRSDKEKMV